MTAESSPRLKSPDSFGETAAPACDSTRAGPVRMRGAVALLAFGVLVAFVPGAAAGNRFLHVIGLWFTGRPWKTNPEPIWIDPRLFDEVPSVAEGESAPAGTSAIELVRSDVGWAVVAATLALVPLLFGWWQRANFVFARMAGIVCAVAGSASVFALVASMRGLSDLPAGVWWTVPLGGALMAAAFVVAPAPRRRDE